MKKLNLCCILAFACASLIFAQSTDYVASGGTWIWPLGADESGQPAGEVVIRPGFVENPVYENVFLNTDYYITADEGMPVYAPVDGTVENIDFAVFSQDGTYVQQMNPNASVEELAKLKDRAFVFTLENAAKNLKIKMNDGEILWLVGFSDINVKEGQKVTKGQQLGTLGYNPTFYTDPSLKIYLEDTKLGLYLLGENNSHFFSILEKIVFSYYPEKMLTKEELTEAFDVLKVALLEDHTALINPLIATKVREKMAEIDIRLNDTKTLRVHDFYLLAKEILASIHCDHTAIRFANTIYVAPASPLQLVLHEKRCFVVWDRRGNDEIPVGTEVFAVNGIPIQELAQKLVSLVSTDTMNPEVAQRMVENDFTDLMESYFLTDSYSFTLKNTVVELPIIRPEQISHAPWRDEINSQSPYEQVDENTAVLRVKKMNDLVDREPWIAYFKELSESGTENLVLDLRGNIGGLDVYTAFLLSYFLEQPFRLFEYREIKHKGVYNSEKYSIPGYSPNYDPDAEYPALLAEFQTSTDGVYKSATEEIFEPAESYGFKGNLYVLLDSFTGSNAVNAARILTDNGAITIGTETKGGYYTINANNPITIQLGQSGLRLEMPLLRTVFTTDESSGNLDWSANPSNRGLIPQHIVYKTLDDKLYRNTVSDSQLNYTLELIKSIEQQQTMGIVLKTVALVFVIVLLVGIPVTVLSIKKRRKAVKETA